MTDTVIRVTEAVEALCTGWDEIIEYILVIDGLPEHKRSKRQYASLLWQLEQWSREQLSGSPNTGNPNKSSSKPPTNAAYTNLLDDIRTEALSLLTEELQQPSSNAPTEYLLRHIKETVTQYADTRQQACETAAHDAEHWVKRARTLLGYEAREVMLAHVVCDECGGALAVAADASTGVRCVGAPSWEACGKAYPRTQWLSLLAARE